MTPQDLVGNIVRVEHEEYLDDIKHILLYYDDGRVIVLTPVSCGGMDETIIIGIKKPW